jgi:hypothetical protein
MPELPETLNELVAEWQELLAGLGHHNGQHIAAQMIRPLTNNQHSRDWYAQNAKIAEVFNLVTDLERPAVYRIIVHDEPPAWQKIQQLIDELQSELTKASDN